MWKPCSEDTRSVPHPNHHGENDGETDGENNGINNGVSNAENNGETNGENNGDHSCELDYGCRLINMSSSSEWYI